MLAGAEDDLFKEYQDAELLWDAEEPECPLDISEENGIPMAEPMLVNKTPAKDDGAHASSPQLHTPQAKELILPFATCNESPIDRCLIAVSTPFQGQRISSTSSDVDKAIGFEYHGGTDNATFDMDKQLSNNVDGTFNINESRHAEGTFIKGGNNSTFMTEKKQSFDIKPAEKDFESAVMESNSHLESSAESVQEKKTQRKPLRAIPRTRIANAAKDPNPTKRVSHLGAPRMNTAAISRIQARSPQSKIGVTNNGTNNSASVKCLKKSSISTSGARARKSLLPSSVKSSKNSSKGGQSRSCNPVHSENISHAPSGTPTKRKAQSPKRFERSPKMGTRTTVPPRISELSGRSSSAPTTKLPSAARSSRLQKPSALKGPASHGRGSTNVKKLTGSSGSLLASSKLNSKTSRVHSDSKSHELLTSAENQRPQPKKLDVSNNAKCATALAILLDYVVNKLNGLSVPKLSYENQQLRKLVSDKDEINRGVSMQLSELKANFADTTRKYEQELAEERIVKDELQQKVTDLLSELENERQKWLEQTTAHDLEREDLRKKHNSDMEEWREKYETLQRNMESQIQDELKERIKPYANSVSEVESLTAVLQMKTSTIHQLQAQCSSFSVRRDEVDFLNHKFEQLKRKNEDLAAQLRDKMEETRDLSEKCHEFQRSFSEEQSRSAKMLLHNEELEYRLNSVGPLSPSFNPVFTTSPVADEDSHFDSTPRNSGPKRTENHSALAVAEKCPRSLSYEDGGEGKAQLNNAL